MGRAREDSERRASSGAVRVRPLLPHHDERQHTRRIAHQGSSPQAGRPKTALRPPRTDKAGCLRGWPQPPALSEAELIALAHRSHLKWQGYRPLNVAQSTQVRKDSY